MADQKFELTRRNALLGLGTIGVASAGAGLGTSAYFSDQEEFRDNTIMAGEFGLSVEQYTTHIDQDDLGPDPNVDAWDEEDIEWGYVDEGVYLTNTILITDAKPGDEYKFCWDITVEDNPGYVAIAGDHADRDGSEAGNVDASELWDVDSNDDLSTLGAETIVDSLEIVNGDESHDYSDSYETLGELLADLEDGVLLHVEGDGDEPIQFDIDKTWQLCVELSIPTDVGNELQGAELVWNKTFYAEQARHNDDMGAFVDRAKNAHN